MLSRVARGVLVAWLILAEPAGMARAGPFEDAVAAYARGNYVIALRLFRPLADRGDVESQYKLGLICRDGLGVPQNYHKAVKWFRKAADQGDADAQNNLGLMYANGQGVSQDYVRALMWLNLAASRLVDPSKLKAAAASRDKIAKLITPVQIADAQRLARKWKPK